MALCEMFTAKSGRAKSLLALLLCTSPVLAMAPCFACVMKRKPHLHDGTFTINLDKEDRSVEIPTTSEPVDGLTETQSALQTTQEYNIFCM